MTPEEGKDKRWPYLVVIKCVNEGNEPPRLRSSLDGHVRNFPNDDGVKLTTYFQVIHSTKRLEVGKNA